MYGITAAALPIVFNIEITVTDNPCRQGLRINGKGISICVIN
jgi:hypothetical protein